MTGDARALRSHSAARGAVMRRCVYGAAFGITDRRFTR
jgi:hypothetical protein